MAYLGALLIFLLATVVTWFMAVALYHFLAGGSDLRQNPIFVAASAVTIVLVTLASFMPFPAGYLVSLVFWWLAANNILELSRWRALLLFVILAVLSIVSRLVMLGVLNF
jgi:hypothetical protein